MSNVGARYTQRLMLNDELAQNGCQITLWGNTMSNRGKAHRFRSKQDWCETLTSPLHSPSPHYFPLMLPLQAAGVDFCHLHSTVVNKHKTIRSKKGLSFKASQQWTFTLLQLVYFAVSGSLQRDILMAKPEENFRTAVEVKWKDEEWETETGSFCLWHWFITCERVSVGSP